MAIEITPASSKLQHIVTLLSEIAATQSTLKLGRHAAALITQKGSILSLGFSHHTGLPAAASPTIHAEAHCIQNFLKQSKSRVRIARREKIDLVVIRVTAAGTELLNSEPCSECVKMLREGSGSFIRRVYYTTRVVKADTSSPARLTCSQTSGERVQRVKRLLRKQCK
ncbi:UNVERIFIED_CONTAM: hypothetical protein HDU68_005386 [Siphonaria sp. JEL0065]|nr:hypothetical protein HDU68_005386 [Siphonaria sp. JEL0065]